MKSKPDLALDSSSIGGRVRSKKQRSGIGPSELMDSSGSSLDLTAEVKILAARSSILLIYPQRWVNFLRWALLRRLEWTMFRTGERSIIFPMTLSLGFRVL
ncbi:hypothetical protein F2Q69_00023307 [Brassica cretica]|uniref:Uncharacterized protein n=1 Tax=Brassica cretica TaxID=69181 RepID=A0A8S9QST6_BRACR|nr:hypothetical protein F2Q69_00023307 [Brassica cretica]